MSDQQKKTTVKTEPGVAGRSNDEHAQRSQSPVQLDFSILHKMIYDYDTVSLEKAAVTGLKFVSELKPFIELFASLKMSSTANKGDAARWSKDVREILSLEKRTESIIGVVGATGAGKSSLVNALLGEEELLPTNCTRACTTCVTEVRFNHEGDGYRAEVEFISSDDWSDEIHVLLNDLCTDCEGTSERRVSPDYASDDTNAGVAFKKLTAVYPNLTVQSIPHAHLETLLTQPEVRKVLGKTIQLKDMSAKGLFNQIQGYVESNGVSEEKKMQHWPLLKVVRVFTKAEALSTGAVIVDLPGLHDSNAARAAVARNYIKDCTGLWVVAPISRAVDDKSARELLGESFRQQLMFDISYATVSFVCSKTDDIPVMEAVKNLRLDKKHAALLAEIKQVPELIRLQETEVRILEEMKTRKRNETRNLRDDLEACEDALSEMDDGEPAQDCLARLGKRKWAATSLGSSVASQFSSAEELKSFVKELRIDSKRSREEKKSFETKCDEADDSLTQLRGRKEELAAKLKGVCIKERNTISTERIRHDFSEGIKAFNESKAMEEDESSDNPEKVHEEAIKVGRNMPVFCISSRVCQKLMGMMQDEDFVTTGYQTVDDTEIPRLQAKAQSMTEDARCNRSRKILRQVCSLLQSIGCWVTGRDIVRAKLDADSIKVFLAAEVNKLKTNLAACREECNQSIRDAVESKLAGALSDLVDTAYKVSITTAEGWFRPPKHGGFANRTFKSICSSKGIRGNRKGEIFVDLNGQLADPLTTGIIKTWKRTFSRTIPVAMDDFFMACAKHLEEFQKAIQAKYEAYGNLSAALRIVEDHAKITKEHISGLSVDVKEAIEERQREANRSFIPSIASGMSPVYSKCPSIIGRGSTLEMKRVTLEHMRRSGKPMFRASVREVKGHLSAMHKTVETMLENGIGSVCDRVENDTLSAFVSATEKRKLSKGEMRLKQELTAMLLTIPDRFGQV